MLSVSFTHGPNFLEESPGQRGKRSLKGRYNVTAIASANQISRKWSDEEALKAWGFFILQKKKKKKTKKKQEGRKN